ncbi:50S ribosomal protein L9 [Candidatus Methanoperedenaceae archaeon GB50]|nr:MAG: 50S ribosomal protein L9 [Candidatus Methanoperedenaceae archaeon GB37]CAD7777120.1 50S ribosomal protein L9 [Candidatus Methanoperedenaceae archaeon GB50]CAD7778144.1 50S ribosomal protein L9 [Candidatus Methanoperedenaceae archaeon GB37]
MKVILKEDISSLGKMGDLINVANGYARNYLIPQNKALPATYKNLKALEQQRQLLLQKREREKQRAQNLAAKLATLTCEIPKQVGEEGKIFGSVTTMDIARSLEEKGIKIDRKKIILEQPIKHTGEYEVPVKLHSEVQTFLKIRIIEA